MNDSSTTAVVLVLLAAIGQTMFVALWIFQGWWRTWIGRALMVKSVAWMVYIDAAIISAWATFSQRLWEALFAGIVLGIYSQLVAMGWEVFRARRNRRKVVGT